MADKSTLRTNVWDVLYTYLQTTNPISTNNIYGSINSKLVNTIGYPFVIIAPPAISFEKLTANGTITQSNITVLIDIYTTSSETVKSLSDNVTNKLLAGRSTFAGQRLMKMEIDPGDYNPWEEGNKKIHNISFTVSFRYVQGG